MRVTTYNDLGQQIEVTDLPESVYVTQDGGFFYFWRDMDHEYNFDSPCLGSVDSRFDPEFGDIEGAMEARAAFVAAFPDLKITF